MRIVILANPAAGRGRAATGIRRAVSLLERSAKVIVRMASSSEDLTAKAAEASREGWDRIVACGGDGTLHHVARGLDLPSATLGILPLGSGNDFARVIGLPKSLERACEIILEGNVTTTDVALANGIPYLGVAGLGFDSIVARYAQDHAKHLRGSLIYFYSILRVLPSFEPHPVAIEDESSREDTTIMFAAIGNTDRYGGGVRITPGADPRDGQLDACIIHETNRLQLLKALPGAYRGLHVRYPFVEQRRGQRFRFDSPETLEVFADGEFVTTTPVEFTISPDRLRVCAPHG